MAERSACGALMITFIIPNRNEPRVKEVAEAIEKAFTKFPGIEVLISNDPTGKGKGWAVRQAIPKAKHNYICIIDGDMDIHPRMAQRLLAFIVDYDIVVGKKQIRGLLSRRILTVLSRLYIWSLFGLNIDTQTGIKLFKKKAIPYFETDGYMFDLEILVKAKKGGCRIIEVPVEANIERKMKFSSILKCFAESLKICWKSL